MTSKINFQAINWITIPKIKHQGEIGTSFWQTLEFSGVRMRIVEYTHDFIDDHWCDKGHIVYCLDGEFIIELQSSVKQFISKGMSFIVSNKHSLHRITSEEGAKLLIIDGDFLSENASFPFPNVAEKSN